MLLIGSLRERLLRFTSTSLFANVRRNEYRKSFRFLVKFTYHIRPLAPHLIKARPVAAPPQQQPFAWLRLAAAIRSNVDRICAAELVATGQSASATRHQCDQAVRFVAHYADDHYRWRAPRSGQAAQMVTVDATRRRSLFEVFTSIAVHLQVGHRVCVRIDAGRNYLKVSGWSFYMGSLWLPGRPQVLRFMYC